MADKWKLENGGLYVSGFAGWHWMGTTTIGDPLRYLVAAANDAESARADADTWSQIANLQADTIVEIADELESARVESERLRAALVVARDNLIWALGACNCKELRALKMLEAAWEATEPEDSERYETKRALSGVRRAIFGGDTEN